MKIQVNKQNVGLRIKQIRLNKGYTLEEFGKLFDTGKSNTRFWEQGRSLPNKERIKAIAKLGDITVNELLYGSVEEYIKENFDELIELTMLDLKGDGYEYPQNIDYKNCLNKFLTPELNDKVNVNDEKAIYNYFKSTFIKSFPRGVTDDEILFMEYYNFFATISTVSEDITPHYSLRLTALNKLYSIMFEYIENNLILFADEYNKDEVHELINKINSLRKD